MESIPKTLYPTIYNAIKYINQRIGYAIINENFLQKPSYNSIVIAFFKGKHLNHEPFDGVGKVLAHAELPPGRKMCFDAEEYWTNKMFYTTFIHEFFHILGFHHSQRSSSVMFPRYQEKQEVVDDVDVANFFKIYPFIKNGHAQ